MKSWDLALRGWITFEWGFQVLVFPPLKIRPSVLRDPSDWLCISQPTTQSQDFSQSQERKERKEIHPPLLVSITLYQLFCILAPKKWADVGSLRACWMPHFSGEETSQGECLHSSCHCPHALPSTPLFFSFHLPNPLSSWVWRCTPLIPALGGQRQIERCEFEASLDYIVRSKIARATQRNPVSKTKKQGWRDGSECFSLYLFNSICPFIHSN